MQCFLNPVFPKEARNNTNSSITSDNLRYSVSWCLWGYPNNTNVPGTPCITHFACGTLENAIKYNNLETNTTEFGYCSQWEYDLVPRCTACLAQGNQHTLANCKALSWTFTRDMALTFSAFRHHRSHGRLPTTATARLTGLSRWRLISTKPREHHHSRQ
jgi:hypothetical protein